MQGAGEQGKGSTLKARRESGRGASYRARTTSRRVVPQDLGEGLQRGHGASKPSSTGELGVTEEDPASLKTIESTKIESWFKVRGRPASKGKLCAMTKVMTE